MTADVIIWPHPTKLPIPAERVAQGALEADLESIFVLGFTKAGGVYLASNKADGGEVLWLMEIAKARLMKIAGEPA